MMQPGNEGEGNSGAAGLPADTRQWLERLRAAHHTPPAGALGPYVDLVEVGRGQGVGCRQGVGRDGSIGHPARSSRIRRSIAIQR